MVPHGIKGTIEEIYEGGFTVLELSQNQKK